MEQEFLKLVAEILEVDAGKISLETKYGEIPQWDSLKHLCIVDEIFEKYGIDIPITAASEIRTIGGFYTYVKNGKES